ncbi:hypothetical protein RchiOBHm_Chr6g0268811 [Rosa chinensis]|uniref:Uncharacterized protein n=1 Tax=Rosa chinensis TaxID=74649 RepID=A0A2P6PQ93_ROSCH|nr:hypothetical protein RchiOBHm_Chr6g0268811 [Rosa chinensis]
MCARDWMRSEIRDAPSTLEDDVDVDEESCHDIDDDLTLLQRMQGDIDTPRGRAHSSPLF